MCVKIIWDDRKLDILKRLYPTTPAADIGDLIGCCGMSVLNMAHKLGLKRAPDFGPKKFYGRYTRKERPPKQEEK
jgi:hypothetical protein